MLDVAAVIGKPHLVATVGGESPPNQIACCQGTFHPQDHRPRAAHPGRKGPPPLRLRKHSNRRASVAPAPSGPRAPPPRCRMTAPHWSFAMSLAPLPGSACLLLIPGETGRARRSFSTNRVRLILPP